MSYKTVVTKANLQYYHGKLKRLIDKIGDVKKIKIAFQLSNTDTNNPNQENIVGGNINKMEDSWNSSSVTHTINIENSGSFQSLMFEDVQDADNQIANFRLFLGDGSSGSSNATIYKKDAVDAKFDAINGMSFQLVDTNIYPTLESFLSKDKWIDTGGEVPQLEAGFWLNKISLYPSNGEYLEYVLILSQPYPEEGAWTTQEWQTNSNFEFVGSTKQDLTGYLKDNDLEATDNDYIDAMYAAGLTEPGAYSSNGDLLLTWDQLIDDTNPEFVYLELDSNKTTIRGRKRPWPLGPTILVLSPSIDYVTSFEYTGVSLGQSNDKFSELIGIVCPHRDSGKEPIGIDVMSVTDHEQNLITPNLRWAAGNVTNVSFVGQESVKIYEF